MAPIDGHKGVHKVDANLRALKHAPKMGAFHALMRKTLNSSLI